MKCSMRAMGMVAAIVTVAPAYLLSQDVPNQRTGAASEAPAGAHVFYWGPVSRIAPHGRPENAWRYRRFDGRWWYWNPDKSWSYFTGDAWAPYTHSSNHYLSRASLLGPIAGPMAGEGVVVQGESAGLTLLPGDHPNAPYRKPGTVLPEYLKQETLPGGTHP